MKFNSKIVFFFTAMFFCQYLPAQIELLNASFEGEHQDATVPVSWHGCERGTTPDILPGVWGVYTEPSEGESYVGLITREDGSWEGLGQRLPTPLEKKICYSFSIDLAHSKTYSGYNKAVKLRIWGGKSKCDKSQLLLETDFVSHTDWKKYTLKFYPESKIKYLIFEAFYPYEQSEETDKPTFFKGNVLLDNISVIKKCPKA